MQIEDFELEVEQALRSIPKEFADKLKNIEIVLEDSAPNKKGSILLGLYQGVPLKNRNAGFEPLMPDKITLYKQSLELISKTPGALRKNIRDTVIHEIGHYFGFEEKDIRKWGY
ncbi:MAG: metallopeptidase family protein [Candidatus Firestonebacteria bacterium]